MGVRMSAPCLHPAGFMSPAEFRRFVAICTYREAENNPRLSPDQWHAFRSAWLLGTFRYSDSFMADRAKLSHVIRECAK